MRGLRAKRVRTVKEGTLIATVDIGATTNTGYCTSVDGREVPKNRMKQDCLIPGMILAYRPFFQFFSGT